MSDKLRRTPLHAEHVRLGARIVPFSGWEMPLQYQGIKAEHEAVRQRAGLFDASHMGQLELRGESAADVVNQLVTNDLGRLEPGQAMYTCCCRDDGGILDDLIVYGWDNRRVMVVCNAANRTKIATHFAAHAAGHCDFCDRSDETALLALQGPRALQIVERAGCSTENIDHRVRPFRFIDCQVHGVDCTLARTGYTGEDGVELFCHSTDARRLYTALMDAGEPLGLKPAGLGARDTLRLEARLALYGNDIDETTNPIEAGLGWTVKLDKASFVGQAALARVKREGVTRRLVGFEMTGRGIARHGYRLLDLESQPVGTCTSGGPAPTLGKNIGLGYLPPEMAPVGTQLRVDCRGKPIAAVVVKTPFYSRRRPS